MPEPAIMPWDWLLEHLRKDAAECLEAHRRWVTLAPDADLRHVQADEFMARATRDHLRVTLDALERQVTLDYEERRRHADD